MDRTRWVWVAIATALVLFVGWVLLQEHRRSEQAQRLQQVCREQQAIVNPQATDLAVRAAYCDAARRAR